MLPVPQILGFHPIFLVFSFMALCLWVQYKWKNAVARKEEIERLVYMVSEESAAVEFEAANEYTALPRPRQCAVCFCPTTTRCSRCKSVHYCSGKCQIIHWRQGHKDECQPLSAAVHVEQGSVPFGSEDSEKQFKLHNDKYEPFVDSSANEEIGPSNSGRTQRLSFEDTAPNMPGSRVSSKEINEPSRPPPKGTKFVNYADSASQVSKLNKVKSSETDEGVVCKSQLPNGEKVMSNDLRRAKSGHKKSHRREASSEMPVTDTCKFRSSPSSSRSSLDFLTNDGEDDSRQAKEKEARSLSMNALGNDPQDNFNGSKKSVWRKLQQLRGSKQSHGYKIIFPYDLFMELYSCDGELFPFGLINCGNSCYANAVLQCLAFTRPLTSYLVRGLHSNACWKKDWCFMCEFQILILKARQGESPLSPIGILSKIQKIGSHLGHGREEDAHEFLRYAVDTMQSVCLKEAGAQGSFAEETTLVGLTFGGYLLSKIKCMRCLGKSERYERMMDLTVEIGGDIETLEEALFQFTADEILDGENKYSCSRCKSYVKAKKKLTILEAPNILTIVLKRFQSGNFEKLDKSIRFPGILDMAPYMSGKSDKSSQYSLYAVIVHRNTMNSTSSGHYLCYVKNFHGDWFGINDSTVIPVELERVLLEEAYMLLYARHHPQAPDLSRNGLVVKSKKRNLEAVPSSLSTSKTKSNSHVLSSELSKAQPKNGKNHYWMAPNNLTQNQLSGSNDWRFHPMQRVPAVDSSSESSIFSFSDTSSCSTSSTMDSARSEEFSDYLFGDMGPSWHNHYGLSSDSDRPALCRDLDFDAYRKKEAWRQPSMGNGWR